MRDLRAYVVSWDGCAALVYARSRGRARWLVFLEYAAAWVEFWEFLEDVRCRIALHPPERMPDREGVETDDEDLQQCNGICFAEGGGECHCQSCEEEREEYMRVTS